MPPFTNSTLYIDANGIDLLRKRFVCRHLDFQEVQHYSIKNDDLRDLTVFLEEKIRTNTDLTTLKKTNDGK